MYKLKIEDLKKFESLATRSEFNTNNAWGFGGAYGTEYTVIFNGNLVFRSRRGTACFRHLPSVRFSRYFINKTEMNEINFYRAFNNVYKKGGTK